MSLVADPAPSPAPRTVQSPRSNPELEVRETRDRVWGEGFWRLLERGFTSLDSLIGRFLPPTLNPLAQTGAVANICLLIALVSGIALLCWYSPSVHNAYGSLEEIRRGSWLGQFVRSLHRHSSDAAMLMVVLHTLRILAARRFTGSRWLGWVSGIGLLGLLWVVGWTGYWLVWDARAQHLAVGSAKFIDVLPVFIEPLGRSFLTNEAVHSLLFFIVFFMHMLLPIAMALVLWVHLLRVNRPKLAPPGPLAWWILGSLAAMAVILPATSAQAADMTAKSTGFTMDWWYLWPIALTGRMGGGALWALFLVGGVAASTVPWWLTRKRLKAEQKAQVDLARCFGCSLCAKDCPFNAITIIPREDGRKFGLQAEVDPDLCTACGICTGACDSEAISVPWIRPREEAGRIEQWIAREQAAKRQAQVAFVSREGHSERKARVLEAQGYCVTTLPSVGWISAAMLERPLKQGAAGILVVGSESHDPSCREGAAWFQARLEGTREPAFDPAKADPRKVRFVQLQAGDSLERIARDFKQGGGQPQRTRGRFSAVAAGAALAAGLLAITALIANLPVGTGVSQQPELVISLKHKGAVGQASKSVSAEEAAKLPAHMRRKAEFTGKRGRAPVRLVVELDGKIAVDRAYPAKGLSADGASIALERIAAPAGAHQVLVKIFDSPDAADPSHIYEGNLELSEGRSRVVVFDTLTGFSTH